MIVFEGIDGSGKSSQANIISKLFSVPCVKFPNYGRIALLKEFLEGRRKLKEESAFLLFLADIMEGTPENQAIIDRYVFSTIAYATSIPLEKAKSVVEALPFRKPEVVVYFDIDPSEGLKRKKSQGVRFSIREKEDYLRGVRERYLLMAKEEFFSDKWIIIDASKTIEEISSELKSSLSMFLK